MLFSTAFLLASLSAFSAFAAPSSNETHLARAQAVVGWPQSTGSAEQAAFGITGGYKQSYLQTIAGAPTLVGNYPKGSYAGATIAGFIFEASGGPSTNLNTAKEVKLTYQVQFPSGFGFALGGKLPGLYGGINPTVAKTCAGGNHNDGCWSARLMWRTNGAGELYAYLPTANYGLPVCQGICNNQYGASIGRGSWSFVPGAWYQVTERVKLNDVGQMNAEIEILIGGQSKVLVKGLQLRGDSTGRISGVMMHTFFGGSSSTSYASPKDQVAYFKKFALQVTQTL